MSKAALRRAGEAAARKIGENLLEKAPGLVDKGTDALGRKLDQMGEVKKPDMSPPRSYSQGPPNQPYSKYPASYQGPPPPNQPYSQYPESYRGSPSYSQYPESYRGPKSEEPPRIIVNNKSPAQTISAGGIGWIFFGLFLVGIIILAALAGTGVISCKASYRGYSGGSSDNGDCCDGGGDSCESGDTKTNS